jgi:hypothetical protein
MIDARPRFCPRCGAEAVGGMPYCRNCGLDLTTGGPPPAQGASKPIAVVPARPTTPADGRPAAPRVAERSSRFPPIIFAGLLVMVGLLGYGFLTRPVAPSADGAPGANGASGASGFGGAGATAAASVAASALIVGLSILTPTDGQAVATKDVNVIGTAPPGVSITRDVSFGLDEHTTSDGTGHWAMRVGLNEGENKLVFRIGDDQSTRHEIRVTYTPPSGG